MPRRDDGTAIRYEFQVFDTPKGKVILDCLEAIKEEGGSVAAYIREALYFYIQHQNENQNDSYFDTQDIALDAPFAQNSGIFGLQFEAEEDEVELAIKTVSDGSSGLNFLHSVLGLQQ